MSLSASKSKSSIVDIKSEHKEKEIAKPKTFPNIMNRKKWKFILGGSLIAAALIIGITLGIVLDPSNSSASNKANSNGNAIVNPDDKNSSFSSAPTASILPFPSTISSLIPTIHPPPSLSPSSSLSNSPHPASSIPPFVSRSPSGVKDNERNDKGNGKDKNEDDKASMCFLVDSLWHIQTLPEVCIQRSDNLESQVSAMDGSAFFEDTGFDSLKILIYPNGECSGSLKEEIVCENSSDDDNDRDYQA
jgi:hypothetical protein